MPTYLKPRLIKTAMILTATLPPISDGLNAHAPLVQFVTVKGYSDAPTAEAKQGAYRGVLELIHSH